MWTGWFMGIKFYHLRINQGLHLPRVLLLLHFKSQPCLDKQNMFFVYQTKKGIRKLTESSFFFQNRSTSVLRLVKKHYILPKRVWIYHFYRIFKFIFVILWFRHVCLSLYVIDLYTKFDCFWQGIRK